MRVAVASDHAGFAVKEALKDRLRALGHEVEDFGCGGPDSCDYADFIVPAARAVAAGRCERAVILGGSGNGEAMAANRLRGVRAAVIHDAYTMEMARRHNDANIASFGTRVVGEEGILRLVEGFLSTPFDGGRHARRVQKLDLVGGE